MDQWIELRRKIRNQEISLRQLERDTGIHRQTLRKIRDHSQPPGYQRTKPIEKTKRGPYLDQIKELYKRRSKIVPDIDVVQEGQSKIYVAIKRNYS